MELKEIGGKQRIELLVASGRENDCLLVYCSFLVSSSLFHNIFSHTVLQCVLKTSTRLDRILIKLSHFHKYRMNNLKIFYILRRHLNGCKLY